MWKRYLDDLSISKRGVFVPRTFVSVTGGNFIAGAILAQIVYWYSPGKDGRVRLKVRAQHPISGTKELCLAKSYAEWYTDIGVTEKQARGAVERLEQFGFIDTAVYRFAGSPTKHIFLRRDTFAEMLYADIEKRIYAQPNGPDEEIHPTKRADGNA